MNQLRHLTLLGCAAVASTACSSNVAPSAASLPPLARASASAKAATPYLYVENGNSTITAFAVAKSGALSEVAGSPYTSNTTGPSSYSIAVDPKGPYVLATGTESDNVAIFSIGSGGALTFLGSNDKAGGGANMLLFAKKDSRLYVVNEVNGGAIAAFDVGKNEKLTSIHGSPYQVTCPGFCTSNPDDVVIGGSYLYSVDTYGWYVSSFSIAKNGALTELNSYPTHYGPQEAALTPSGTYMYVTNGASADISAYGVAAGVLTQLTGSPFKAGGTPSGIVMTSNGKYLYVADYGDGTISGYSISGDGALVQLKGSPFADGSGVAPTAIAIDKGNAHLFVTNQGTGTIAVYAIGGSGSLAQIKGSPFAESGNLGPRGLALYEP
jgi:6-phosphogluconolactonase